MNKHRNEIIRLLNVFALIFSLISYLKSEYSILSKIESSKLAH